MKELEEKKIKELEEKKKELEEKKKKEFPCRGDVLVITKLQQMQNLFVQ